MPLLRSAASQAWHCISACAALNATPVCIGSAADQARAEELMSDGGSFAWLGTFQPLNEGWQWSTDCNSTYSASWRPGDPNDISGPENCAFVMSSGLWMDYQCALHLPCLCDDAGLPVSQASEAALAELEAYERSWAEQQIHLFFISGFPFALVPICGCFTRSCVHCGNASTLGLGQLPAKTNAFARPTSEGVAGATRSRGVTKARPRLHPARA